jgi:plasmid stability protein
VSVNVVISTYLDSDLADRLRERARLADRSLAAEVRRTLIAALKSEGA